jgi:hypothetical protein
MPQKVDFKDYDEILANFDAFCDEFESRASNAFMRGDQNDGRVNEATAEIGDSTPEVVREVREPGAASIPSGAPYIDVQATSDE